MSRRLRAGTFMTLAVVVALIAQGCAPGREARSESRPPTAAWLADDFDLKVVDVDARRIPGSSDPGGWEPDLWTSKGHLIVHSPADSSAMTVSCTRRDHSCRYPRHTNIVATTFWVGEVFDPDLPDGSQVCSTYDSQWAFHWSGVRKGRVPRDAAGCAGSITGGCDGRSNEAGTRCRTERRLKRDDYFPRSGRRPLENPFYLDLPYDDLNDRKGFKRRCQVVPWADKPRYRGHCKDRGFSYLKNRWVRIKGPGGRVCYGQIQDAGPSHGRLYHDARYVFGSRDHRPRQQKFNNAGMDVSPALNGCLGFKELNGKRDRVSWRFVDRRDVPKGPWTIVVTRSKVS